MPPIILEHLIENYPLRQFVNWVPFFNLSHFRQANGSGDLLEEVAVKAVLACYQKVQQHHKCARPTWEQKFPFLKVNSIIHLFALDCSDCSRGPL